MNVFSFDQRYFFDRQPGCERWYACLHPALNRDASDEFAHGYFRVSDGHYDGPPGDGRCFSAEQIREIEVTLASRVREMDLKQFDVYRELPRHYQELGAKTNRYSDIFHRLRTSGCYDPDFAVAFDQLISEEPAYRLTREFVGRVLERAGSVSAADRDKRLREVLRDSWIYDVEPDPNRKETFETYYKKSVNGLMFPKPVERREGSEYTMYQIEGLPRVYMVAEESTASDRDSFRTIRHYLDRESAIVPLGLPGDCYII
ncbi:hypothetical protein [Lacipirellula parvula]|uniref:Uncharacterized protein n=1 Tax=Lacipirellula parvula TaxID=2650471 RepID=A0A5K7XIT0_9BACT|nr:hypothetical protein [Lacipirellula parvula]BBO36325.1 hypothetical protein PLANPX_5937 [Lacipirellula parvula]